MKAPACRPLDGVVVVDFTWALAGPTMTSWLAAAGATVIKIENAERPDLQRVVEQRYGRAADGEMDDSPGFHEVNGGKLSISLDLKHPGAHAVVKRLVSRANLVTESFRPGVLERLGLGPSMLWDLNPSLVVVSVCSWRPGTALGGFAGYAPIFAAYGGLAHATRDHEGPPSPVRVPMDVLTGTYGGLAAMAGLVAQTRRAQGAHYSVSGVESATTTVADLMVEAQYGGRTDYSGNDDPSGAAPHGVFRASDGRWVAVAAVDAEHRASIRALTETSADSHRHDLEHELKRWIGGRSAEAAERALNDRRVPAAVVQTLTDVAHDPHLAARGFFRPVARPPGGHQLVAGVPWTVDGERMDFGASPRLGEHTEQVLAGVLGMSADEISDLRDAGALG